MVDKLTIRCPLCCNETFESHSSLKYHLLSINDHLQCTECSQRFDTILELAEHIGRKCENENEESTEIEVMNKKIKSEDKDLDGPINPNNSILAKALLKEDLRDNGEKEIEKGEVEITEMEVEEESENNQLNEKDDEEECFYCSTCAISFTSVGEHLEKYHEGQEVFIETDDQQEDAEKFVVMNKEDDSEEILDEDSNADLLNTLQQEEILDKDGRVYTRKVVQIEKFWNDDQNKKIKDPPLTHKYIVENNKVSKLNDEEDVEKNTLDIHQCSNCSLNFCKLEQYYKHKCNPKNNANEHKCNKCSATFQTVRSLSVHMKSHTEKSEQTDTFICEFCSTEFPSFKSLRLHSRMHEPVKAKEIEPPAHYGILGEETGENKHGVRVMFVCHICNKTYDKEYEEVHMKSHNNEQNFDCEICNRKFYTKTNLEMHLRVHSNGKKFTCSYCKKAFLNYENLQNHVKHLCQSRPYECQYCGRRFMRPHEKVKHERIHTGEKPHVCEICGKAFRVSYCLTLHMRTHSGARPYQCNHCGKRFKAHSVYNHHLLTHSTARNYKCPYCPKAFKTGVQLAGHKNSHIKPFTCTECNRPFASLYAVRAHMETHKRENNLKYSCCLCGASYARSFALRDHIKEHHAGETVEVFEMEKGLMENENEYEMVSEGLNASNMILKDDEATNDVLVVLDETMENVEMVEEIAA